MVRRLSREHNLLLCVWYQESCLQFEPKQLLIHSLARVFSLAEGKWDISVFDHMLNLSSH